MKLLMKIRQYIFVLSYCLFAPVYAHTAQPLLTGLGEGPRKAGPPAAASSAVDEASKVDRVLLEGVEDRAPVRNADENYYEAQAYNYLLVKAHKTSPNLLAKTARHDLTFAHLFEEPRKYRGQLIHLEARLKRLRRFDAPKMAEKDGVPQLYEGWLFTDSSFGNPYCIVFSELPPSIHIGENLDIRVAFDGYFFKRYRYKAADKNLRDAPLLIGRQVKSVPIAATPANSLAESFSVLFLPAFLGVLGGTAALALGLTCWFRRGDRRVEADVKSRIQDIFADPDSATDAVIR